jgi:hypothetical protein
MQINKFITLVLIQTIIVGSSLNLNLSALEVATNIDLIPQSSPLINLVNELKKEKPSLDVIRNQFSNKAQAEIVFDENLIKEYESYLIKEIRTIESFSFEENKLFLHFTDGSREHLPVIYEDEEWKFDVK